MFADDLWIVFSHLATTSAIAFGVLWLIFKFYLKEYEMDAKSQAMISLKTFGTFILINFIFLFWLPWFQTITPPFFISVGAALWVAHNQLVKAGMEKNETWRVGVPWFIIMLGIALIYMYSRGITLGAYI